MTLNLIIHGWKNLKNHILSQYGMAQLTNFLDLQYHLRRRCKIKNDIIFLKKCNKNQVLPNFLQIKNNFGKSRKIDTILKTCGVKILQTKINQHFKDLKIHDKEVDHYENELRMLPPEIFKSVIHILSKDEKINHEKIKHRQVKKLKGLTNLKAASTKMTVWRTDQITNQPPTDWERSKVINLSSHNPSNEEVKVLALGFHYSLRPSQEQKSLDII